MPIRISEIVVYVDGGFVAAATYGEPRPDVARAYPGFLDGRFPGWKITLDSRLLTRGAHELLIQARSRTGLTRDLASFSITVASEDDRARLSSSNGVGQQRITLSYRRMIRELILLHPSLSIPYAPVLQLEDAKGT